MPFICVHNAPPPLSMLEFPLPDEQTRLVRFSFRSVGAALLFALVTMLSHQTRLGVKLWLVGVATSKDQRTP